ncbi:hypothetical protein APT61_13555 [Leclercia adecarboxylata]|uniref:pyocin knob domain-containing S74 family peptidase n=1 Tax=Leclercia adecarboxylata TaxID=83655 RepID=UPI000744C0F2|nr:pyocin knob domain-containing S74 family peptidase [Leclercia adecarboxylata]ALZ96979.1 hypothetical protein APT61_13555 [Leclercia adecarboxylata]
MSAGTIKLTNGSTAVVGTGTAFTSDLKSGDVITATVGGIFFTLFVNAVTSNTALTLTDPFTGPTTSGLAWVAVPQLTLNRITAALAAQTAESVRRVLQENANWQAFYTGTGDITVTLPDGTPTGRPVPGPSWAKIAGLTNSALQWRGGIPGSSNLNNFGPTSAYAGAWGQSSVSVTAADLANGYPAAERGVLEVFAGGRNNCTQRYTTDGGRFFVRWLAAAWNAASPSWSDWIEIGGLSSNTVLPASVTTLSDATYFAQNQTYVLSGTRTDSPAGLTAGQNNAIIMSMRRAGGTIMGLHQTLFTAIGTYERYGAPNAATGWTSVNWYSGGDANGWRLLGADAMAVIGIGQSNVAPNDAFDWQQIDMVTGQKRLTTYTATAWVNTPPGITYNSGTNVDITCVLNQPNRLVLRLTSNAQSNGNRAEYVVTCTGVKGSRNFTVVQNYNSDASSVIPVANGGTGEATASAARTALGVAYGSAAGTVAQGNDTRLNTVNNKTGGNIISSVTCTTGSTLGIGGANNPIYLTNNAGDGSPMTFTNQIFGRWYNANWVLGGVRGGGTELSHVQLSVNNANQATDFTFKSTGVATATQWQDVSDDRKKENKRIIEEPIEKMKTFRGITFSYIEGGSTSAGYIAQEVRKVLPEVISEDHEGFLSMNVAGVGALHHEAILALVKRVEYLEARLGLQPDDVEPEETGEQPDVQQ